MRRNRMVIIIFVFMKVTTLDNPAFAVACSQLEEMSRGFAPDLIVGIASGGEYMARIMFSDIDHIAIESRRPSTAGKEGHDFIWMIIRNSPLWIRDNMRRIESLFLASRQPKAATSLALSSEQIKAAAEARRILVIDDSIDSGATMKRVIDALRIASPDAIIATAVITVTTRNPVVNPDFCLYSDRRLVRFPWSKDFRQ